MNQNKPVKKTVQANKVVIKNKKASFEYEFLDTYVAGIVLKGTEIKSIRDSKASINEAYCYVEKGQVFVKNMHIGLYQWASFAQHETKAIRKLLLNAREIKQIFGQVKNTGITAIPLKLFINEKGLAKLEIAVVKGKKLYDKREDIKNRDNDRMLGRLMKKTVG